MNPADRPSSPVDASSFQLVVGIDIGSQTCSLCGLQSDKSQVIKPVKFANAPAGCGRAAGEVRAVRSPARAGAHWSASYFAVWGESVPLFGKSGLSGVEARIPDKPISLLKPRGLRAKTDTLDATTIARVLLSGEARRGYVPTDLIATYRELVRLHTQLSDEVARYKNEIQALLIVLFPEFSQVAARSVSKDSPSPPQTLSECASDRDGWG